MPTKTVSTKNELSPDLASRTQIDEIFAEATRNRGEWFNDYLKGAPEEMEQFAFFLGRWETSLSLFDLDGKLMQEGSGLWEAKSIDNGRMIMDSYRSILPNGDLIHGGLSLRTYSPQSQQWEMTYLRSMEPLLISNFVAQFEHNEIRATAQGWDSQGNKNKQKVRFFNITENAFDWEMQASWDEGETWYRLMTISAARKDQ